jgi:hypothetical protein
MINVPRPVDVPALDLGILTGDESAYPACQAEARRLRHGGAAGLVAPSAAVLSGEAELFAVDTGGQYVVQQIPTEAIVLFGPPAGIVGEPAAEGHPSPAILTDVRHL